MISSIKTFFGFSSTDEETSETPSILQTKDSSSTDGEKHISSPFSGTLIPGNKGTHSSLPFSEIKVEEPRIYEDSLTIATFLREQKPVLVNLKHLDTDTGKRLIDFVCGTAYAINGHMMKIGDSIFLFTPEKVLIVDSGEPTTFQHATEEQDSSLFLQQAVG